ncbi:MAG: ATP-binding protein [Sulfurimonadaceae bacterium]|jgi:predicted AAA+ superfamily ATPase|nr:ATP-binding protein [Sulfurimonadaceae bacterium]
MEYILLEDNPHWNNLNVYDNFISREVLSKALSYLTAKQIIALIGARRVGKSTLAKLMIKELLKTVPAKNIFFINLEKPEFIPYKENASYLEEIYDSYLKLANPDLSKKIYFFIDEIQIFKNWEVFVKSKYENSNIKFIITGSNSSLLSSDFATVLTGRVLKLPIYSFSFTEFLNFKNISYKTRLEQVSNKIEISRAKDEYLKWGGYYDVISIDDVGIKRDTLKNIAEDIIFKDIVPRYSIKNSSQLKDLYYYIVSNATSLLNYLSLSKKIGIDAKTIKEYINYFEDNFLIHTISSYHTKVSEQIKSAKKLYLSDNGFLNLGINRSINSGTMLENEVFILLNRSCEELTYVKANYEIDFRCENRLYQVSYNIQDEKTRQRELRAFESFDSEKRYKYKLITYDETDSSGEIDIVKYEDFVLELQDKS